MSEIFKDRKICTNEERIQWFKEAKFGMFIHWGLYAQLAGSWKGKQIDGIGEQIMRFAKIPAAEYHEIAKAFNPVKFSADEWVRIAKDAGMRYIVITAKHHDGFAMYESKCSPYNIVDATPYRHDPMKDLAAACQKHGIKLCFYYSHYQDWDDPNGVVKGEQWDETYPEKDKIFETYMNGKAIPQLTELLTYYGPVGILWFDTPGDLSHYNAKRFNDLVHAIQPECIVAPRVSSDELGDYIGYGDNQVPGAANTKPWETCATMNDTWGFKAQDNNWKSPATLIRLLVSIVSKGGNYLLNVGPTCEGIIPPESVQRLETIGKWLRKNGDSIYNATGCLLPHEVEWGAVTGNSGKLYLHLFDWPKNSFIFTGLKNKVKSVKLLATGDPVAFRQEHLNNPDMDQLILSVPAQAPDEYVSVILLEIEGDPVIDSTANDCNGSVILNASAASLQSASKSPLFALSSAGIMKNWSQPQDYVSWCFKLTQPGDYKVEMNTFSVKNPEKHLGMEWEGGHILTVTCNKQEFDFTVKDDGRSRPRDLFHWQNIVSSCGTLHFEHPGEYTLTLCPKKLHYEKELGLSLKSVVLRQL